MIEEQKQLQPLPIFYPQQDLENYFQLCEKPRSGTFEDVAVGFLEISVCKGRPCNTSFERSLYLKNVGKISSQLLSSMSRVPQNVKILGQLRLMYCIHTLNRRKLLTTHTHILSQMKTQNPQCTILNTNICHSVHNILCL